MDYKPLDGEILENLTFQRSKKWSHILDDFSRRIENEEYDLSDLDEVFADNENDDFNMFAHHDEAEVDDDRSESELLITHNDDSNEDENNELHIIMNQTIPVLAEQERRWKAAGLDHILNSFDVGKIEESVSDWIRHNRSHNNSECALNQTTPVLATSRYQNNRNLDLEYSDNESMQSAETARYIRSSRKQNAQHRSKTTTIKTYRTIQSKRDELRKKYYVPEYDEDHYNQLNGHPKRKQQYQHTLIQNWEPTHYKTTTLMAEDLAAKRQLSQRRKQLRKRRSISSARSSSSHDSTIRGTSCSRYLPRCCQSMYYGRVWHSGYTISKQKNCCEGASARKRTFDYYKRTHKRGEDCCRCCNDLCENDRHLVISSSEEWLVTNCDLTDKKIPMQDFGKNNIFESLRTHKINSLPKHAEKNKEKVTVFGRKDSDDIGNKVNDIRNKHSYNNKNNDLNDDIEKTVNVNEVCKNKSRNKAKPKIETKEKASMIKKKQAHNSNDSLSSNESYSPIKKYKISTKKYIIRDEDFDTSSSDIEIKRAIQESKNLYQLEQARQKMKQENILNCNQLLSKETHQNSAKHSSKPHLKSIKIHQTQKSDENKVKPKPAQRIFSASTSLKISSIIPRCNLSIEIGAKPFEKNSKLSRSKNEIPVDNDCSIVTSTTNSIILQKESSKNKHFNATNRKLQQFEKTNCKKPKDIIIYTPSEREFLPSENFQNGCINITTEHLGTVIGTKSAHKFFQVYLGPRKFDVNSTVCYRPPKSTATWIETEEASSDNDSDFDVFDNVGELYELR